MNAIRYRKPWTFVSNETDGHREFHAICNCRCTTIHGLHLKCWVVRLSRINEAKRTECRQNGERVSSRGGHIGTDVRFLSYTHEVRLEWQTLGRSPSQQACLRLCSDAAIVSRLSVWRAETGDPVKTQQFYCTPLAEKAYQNHLVVSPERRVLHARSCA